MTKKQRRDQGNGMDQPRRGGKRSGPQEKPKSATVNSVSDGDKLPDGAAAHALHNGYAQLSAADGSGPAGQAIWGILAGIRDGFVMLDKDWRYTYVNEAGAAFLKTTPDKLIGRTIWEAFPEVRRSRFYEEFTGAVEQKAFVEFEEYYEPLHRWYECRCYPIDGGLTVLFSDTTGHKLTEQALLESRLALEVAITGSNAGVWRIDLDPERPGFMPDYVYLSPQLKAFIGLAADELPNSRSAWQARILPEDLVRVQESMQAHAEGRTESYQADFRIRHKDGSIRWLSSRGRLYRDEYDRPIRWAGIDWDITDRKQAEEALQKAHDELEIRVQERTAELRKAVDIGQAERQRFNDVLETLPAYLVLLTPDHHVPFANRFFRERFGASHGKRCFEYLFNRTEPCEPCDAYKVLETNAPHRWEWTGPDGRNYDIYDFPFTDVDGSTLIMEIGIDITDRKRAEQKLAKENREIALANRILRVFVEETGDDLFDKALAFVLEGMASRHGVFGYVDERGHLICPSMSKLLDECEVPGKCIDHAPEKWKGLWARAISEKRTLYTNEAPAVPKGHVPIRNNLAAPILFQGRAIGLLDLANKETDYTDADRELIEAIADRIAPVLYAWIQRELRENGRKQAEETVHQSEQRLRLALEGGGMGLWEWDLSNNSSFWDQRVYELLGVDALREARIETFLDCVYPEDRAAVKQLIQSSLTDRANFQTEFRIVRHRGEARGEILWLALLGKILRDKQGQAGRMIGVLYDISLRKQMEDQLRRLNDQLEEEVRAQTEELRDTVDRLQDEVARRVLAEGKLRKNSRLLEAFFQHTITPMAFLDKYFNFVRVNEAYAKAQGQSPEFFVRKNHFVLCPDEETRSILEQVVRTKRPYYAYGKSYAPCNDSHRGTTHWNWRITPLLDDLGDVQFLVFNLEDVTERQKAFGELQQRAHQLQRLALELSQAEDRERRRLAEVLHDDLQQVLAATKFHLGLLGSRIKDEVDAQAQELLEQLGKMLREAIEKSRGLSHELSPAVLYQSDLGETFEWLARQVQAKHGLTVHTEVHGQVDSQSEPIKAFLFRAAQEILFNAVKHAKVEEARLRLQRRRGQLWLTIGDQGRGFDPHGLDRAPGFGLLSIRERVELLGGRMKIHSAQGRGSVFLITIADAEESEDRGRKTEDREQRTAPPSVVRLPSSGPGRRLRVLLVDDHKTMREGLAALIKEQQDMEIVGQADDGGKAVTLARELMPDVVIMDMAMPVMPGDEATRRIKAELPQARVVALSMFEEPGVAQRMLDAGAEVYLPKTGPFENLLAAIRGH